MILTIDENNTVRLELDEQAWKVNAKKTRRIYMNAIDSLRDVLDKHPEAVE